MMFKVWGHTNLSKQALEEYFNSECEAPVEEQILAYNENVKNKTPKKPNQWESIKCLDDYYQLKQKKAHEDTAPILKQKLTEEVKKGGYMRTGK